MDSQWLYLPTRIHRVSSSSTLIAKSTSKFSRPTITNCPSGRTRPSDTCQCRPKTRFSTSGVLSYCTRMRLLTLFKSASLKTIIKLKICTESTWTISVLSKPRCSKTLKCTTRWLQKQRWSTKMNRTGSGGRMSSKSTRRSRTKPCLNSNSNSKKSSSKKKAKK